MYRNYRAEFEQAFALGARTPRAFFISHHPMLGFASNPNDPQNPFPGNARPAIGAGAACIGRALFPPNVDVVLSGHNHVLEIVELLVGASAAVHHRQRRRLGATSRFRCRFPGTSSRRPAP